MRLAGPLSGLAASLAAGAALAQPITVTVDVSAAGVRNTIRPALALGAGVDGTWRGGTDQQFTPGNVAALRTAGLQSLTYRLRTELGIEAWHWNPAGTWSDPAHAQGYWTSSDRLESPIQTSWGYQLPRRGDSIDMANNQGYSRLDDGDLTSFWKSNPYLDARYTHDPAPHRPWFIIELGGTRTIDTADIAWGEPYARRYRIQYWAGADEYDPEGRWVTFGGGEVRHGRGGEVRLRLTPKATAFVRVVVDQGSMSAPPGSADVRDRLGVAVREAGFGHTTADGRFEDAVRHAPSREGQSIAHVSSTDPWHRAQDRDPELEQPGFDRVFESGLTNGRPVMVPVPVLYDIPENAAAELRYLKARGYPLARVELGEEPDGQYVDAADYGALYLQTAARLRPIAPDLPLGGPSLQSALSDVWLSPGADRSWNSRFIAYLKGRRALGELQFFSFEHYPYDDICGDIYAKLLDESRLMTRLFARLRAEGVPDGIPWYIAEYGFSAFSGRAEAELPSALLMADILGRFLTEGGDGAYLFGYWPSQPANQHQPCAGYGNLMLFMADASGGAGAPMPSYYAARLITGAWLEPGDRPHALLAVRSSDPRIQAYATRRPDGRLGLLLINRDSKQALSVALAAAGKAANAAPIRGPAETWTYSPAQYEWVEDGPLSHPGRDLPPAHAATTLTDTLDLPPASLTVIVR